MINKKDNQLVLVAKESGLEPNKIDSLLKSFSEHFGKAKVLADSAKEIVVTDKSQTSLMSKARESRLELKRIRVGVEKTRIELKAQSLREIRAIDGVSNLIKALVVPVEEHLEKQEKFIEILETERLQKLHEKRIMTLTPFVEDITLYNIKDMSEDAFSKLLESSKKACEDQKAAEIKAEKERIAREKAGAEEAKRIRDENEKLRKEAEEVEKKAVEIAKQQEAKLEAEKEKREKVEAKLKEEKEAQEKKESEARAIEEAKKKAEEEAKRQSLLAPDKEKLNKLAAEIDSIKFPAVENQEASETLIEVRKQLTQATDYLREKSKGL